MRICQNASLSPGCSIQKPMRQSTIPNVYQKLSVFKSTDPTATKWWYSCVWRVWGVSVRVISVGSVGRVGRVLQVKGGLFANVSQKVSQISFFLPKQSGKSQPPDFQSPYVIHPIRIIQHPLELIPFKLWVTRLPMRLYDRSNSSGMYIGLKIVLNWVHVLKNCLQWGGISENDWFFPHNSC